MTISNLAPSALIWINGPHRRPMSALGPATDIYPLPPGSAAGAGGHADFREVKGSDCASGRRAIQK